MRHGSVFDKLNKKVLLGSLATLLLGSVMPLVAAALEDPTRPPDFVGVANGAKQSQVPTWQVSSILISKDRRMAVVNGKTVRQGDQVDSARVIRISPIAVTLRSSVETFTVKLLPAQVKSAREE
jgi:MSHA biogenesis protein MshK